MSINNCWTISSSYDFQAHQQHSQRRCFFQTALLWFKVLPDLLSAVTGAPRLVISASRLVTGAPKCFQASHQRSHTGCCGPQVLSSSLKVFSCTPRCSQIYCNHSHDTPVPAIRDPSYSDGWQKCPPRVWYSPEIGASKITLHILSDTPGGFRRLKYILLM